MPRAHGTFVHDAVGHGEFYLYAQHDERHVVLSGAKGLVQQLCEHTVQLDRRQVYIVVRHVLTLWREQGHYVAKLVLAVRQRDVGETGRWGENHLCLAD